MIQQLPLNAWLAAYWDVWFDRSKGQADIEVVYEDASGRWIAEGQRDPATVAREDWAYAVADDGEDGRRRAAAGQAADSDGRQATFD